MRREFLGPVALVRIAGKRMTTAGSTTRVAMVALTMTAKDGRRILVRGRGLMHGGIDSALLSWGKVFDPLAERILDADPAVSLPGTEIL
jgi:hypothetical protein